MLRLSRTRIRAPERRRRWRLDFRTRGIRTHGLATGARWVRRRGALGACLPARPQPIDKGVVEPEQRIGGRGRRGHGPADRVVDQAVEPLELGLKGAERGVGVERVEVAVRRQHRGRSPGRGSRRSAEAGPPRRGRPPGSPDPGSRPRWPYCWVQRHTAGRRPKEPGARQGAFTRLNETRELAWDLCRSARRDRRPEAPCSQAGSSTPPGRALTTSSARVVDCAPLEPPGRAPAACRATLPQVDDALPTRRGPDGGLLATTSGVG
jgi:hypothetical protein